MEELHEDKRSDAWLANELRRSVSAFVRGVRKETDTVRSAQFEALELLDRLGAMNVAALAERRGVTHQTMRMIVAGLEGSGLVQNAADPADGRSRLFTISRAGEVALAHDRQIRTSWIEKAIRTYLSPDERDLLCASIPLIDRLAEL